MFLLLFIICGFTDAGPGNVDVGIVDPQGKKDTIRPFVVKKTEDTWYVEYIPLEPGLHSVNVFFIGQPVPKSPYAVGVGAG
jgi:filamin